MLHDDPQWAERARQFSAKVKDLTEWLAPADFKSQISNSKSVTHHAPTGRSAGSLSWAGLGNTYYWIDPAAGIGGVFATQILPFADSKALPLFLAFETAVYRGFG